jgi:predicted nucleic acid-binding protein
MVLVDTSVWIHFFRDKSSTAAKALDSLLEQGEACICGLIEAELIPGLRRGDRTQVRILMAGLPRLEIPPDIWPVLTDIQEKALSQGMGPFSIPDLLLTALALRNEAALFSLDRHFEALARLTGLKIWP